MPDVYLLTDGLAVPNLTLHFLETGLALEKAAGGAVWECPWSDLAEMSVVERSVLPGGRDGVAILVLERGDDRREHRFVLATTDPAETESVIRGRAAAHGLRTTVPRSPVSKILTLGIVLLALATLTALLLSAVHVFRF